MENKDKIIEEVTLRNIALLNEIDNLKNQIKAYETTVYNLKLKLGVLKRMGPPEDNYDGSNYNAYDDTIDITYGL